MTTKTGEADPPKQSNGFKDILDKWKSADKSADQTPFAAIVPKRQKSVISTKNKEAIKEYRKDFANFRNRKSGRGLGTTSGKPTQLKDVFGIKLGDDLSSFVPPVYEKSDSEVKLIKDAIQHNFFFDDLTPGELDIFINAFQPLEMTKGMAIIYQGEDGDYFYIVSEGKVTFEMDKEYVGEAGPGHSFGELALLYVCPRAATVYAASDPTKLFRVDQKTFRGLLQKQTKKMEADKLKLLEGIDFLKDMDEADLKRLGRAMMPRTFKENDLLVKKGEEGNALYIVKEGELLITDISVGSNEFPDVSLKPGDYFGERALATDEPRAANVTAKTNGVVFAIDRKTFEKVLGKFSRLIIKAQDKRLLVS